MRTLTDISKEVSALAEQRNALTTTYQNAVKQMHERAIELTTEWENVRKGIDTDKLALGRTIIEIGGSYQNGGEDRDDVLGEAVRRLSHDRGGVLKDHYFATKDYAQWRGQRCNPGYGCVPSYGHIVFSIGLTPDARSRELTDEEIEAAIYLIANLHDVEQSQSQAAAATTA